MLPLEQIAFNYNIIGQFCNFEFIILFNVNEFCPDVDEFVVLFL